MEHHLRQRLERLQCRNSSLSASVRRKQTMIRAQRQKIDELQEQLESLRHKLRALEEA